MLQRIQSLYLLLSVILTIVLLFIPIGYIGSTFEYNAFVLKEIETGSIGMLTFYIAAMLIISAIISIVVIFLYKNRKRQMNLISLNMMLFLITYVLMLWVYPDFIFTRKGFITNATDFVFNHWIMLGIVPAFLMILANRAIRKDEELVRSADRLR